ncbi:YdeI/OmpD-associated family protein [Bacillus alkalisoli]|uniref:YdeI/OmpD-associated family protein n=1 Tax=Bacillus alkalisoli TaxID=2011008 RepID=UPI000C243D9F|nr:YdeI/OmpD-associated family protein [Bacillus alkalisoli]
MNSTKSITEKLNFKKYPTKLILNVPAGYKDFEEIQFDSAIVKEKYHLIFFFIFKIEQFREYVELIINKQLLEDNGYVFFAYPKKNNPKYEEYIERDTIYSPKHLDENGFLHGSNIKFSRMVSLDDVFTVIGFKAEAQKKKKTTTTPASQCVDDYIKHVDDIKDYLKGDAKVLKIYNELTYGYQKDWARYVYSAKRKETQDKRLEQMKEVLIAGYKSMDLYRRKK